MTKAQQRMMENIGWAMDRRFDGYAPAGSGEWRVIRALIVLGYVEHVGVGGDERTGREHAHIYGLTDAGRAALAPETKREAGR